MGAGPFELARAIAFAQEELPHWPQFKGRQVIATHRGRSAIAKAFELLGLSAGDEVLVPSYNCGSEIDPVFHCGAVPVLYRVDRRGEIDLEDLKRRRTSRTKVVYVTHYFGWPQRTDELEQWCLASELVLIEDCALSLFSSAPSGPVGMAGDAAIFSLTKSLPVPDGGVLSLAKQRGELNGFNRPPRAKRVLRGSLSLLKRAAVQQCDRWNWPILARQAAAGSNGAVVSNVDDRPDMPADYYFDSDHTGRRMSRVTHGLIRDIDPGSAVHQRRANFQHLHELLKGAEGFEPLYDELPTGVCPLIYPALVKRRSEVARRLQALRVDVIEWWSGYHRALPWDEFEEACFLKDHLLALPIHQQLNETHIRHVAQCARDAMCLR